MGSQCAVHGGDGRTQADSTVIAAFLVIESWRKVLTTKSVHNSQNQPIYTGLARSAVYTRA
jgi:hypothetical protein